MNAETLELISIIAFACAAFLCIVAIVMFFKMNIRAIVDDLSGKKAERQIKELREQNRSAEARVRMPMDLVSRNAYRTERQGTTFSRLRNQTTAQLKQNTEPLREGTVLLSEETTLLETTLLEEGTTLLEEGTTLLDEGTVVLEEREVALENGYCLLLEEIVVHTHEGV